MICVNSIIPDGSNGFFVLSFLASALALLPLLTARGAKSRLFWAQAHLFFIVFPFFTYFFFKTCQTFFFHCADQWLPVALLALLVGGLAVIYVVPRVYIRRMLSRATIARDQLQRFVSMQTKDLALPATTLHYLDDARPIAFSVSLQKPLIFLSVGLCELLNRKEIEAVLLHELSHIKHRHSSLRQTFLALRFLSPIAAFSPALLNREEREADNDVARMQHTMRHIFRARDKINHFEKLI